MPRNQDREMRDAFERAPGPGKFEQEKCKACGQTYAHNTNRMRNHLVKYHPYLEAMRTKWEMNTITLQSNQPLPTNHLQIIVPRVKQAAKLELDAAAAMAVYTSNIPFTFYQSPHQKASDQLRNLVHTPPSAAALSGALLDQAYERVRS
ncbi:MAG: hypothetical protein M1829_001498 [Trizodia sp. TS-e1964]|nr:MAG: hypothetical protein M1829_001498 [Trizodia sp. TS-e1964]